MKKESVVEAVSFADLGLSEIIVRAVKSVGYESASPIQAAPSSSAGMVAAWIGEADS